MGVDGQGRLRGAAISPPLGPTEDSGPGELQGLSGTFPARAPPHSRPCWGKGGNSPLLSVFFLICWLLCFVNKGVLNHRFTGAPVHPAGCWRFLPTACLTPRTGGLGVPSSQQRASLLQNFHHQRQHCPLRPSTASGPEESRCEQTYWTVGRAHMCSCVQHGIAPRCSYTQHGPAHLHSCLQ